MLKNNKYLFISLGVLACLLIGGIVGWQLRTPKPPQVEVVKTIERDTIEVPIKVQKTEYKYITKVDTIFQKDSSISKTVYSDSLQGEKNNVAYSIVHKIFVSDSVKSFWDLDIKAKSFQLFETTSYDSILTIHKTEYVATPFFLNHWFYTTLLFFTATVLSFLFGS